MNEETKEPDRSGSIGRLLRSAAIIALLWAAFLVVTTWLHPLWLLDQFTKLRLGLYGVHSETVSVRGYQIHYLVGGSGQPLVLIHGLGSRGADWADLIPALIRGGYRIYAPDLLGYGLSSKPSDASYSIPLQASIVQGFLDSQQLSRVDMAGWSMGGWIAMRVALDQPERIRRLVLLDSAGLRFKLSFDPGLFEPSSPEQLAALKDLLTPSPHAFPQFLTTAMLRRGEKLKWVVRRSVDSMMTGDDLLDGKLSSLTMPVLVGWGKEDRLIPLTTGYQLHAEIPQSVLAVYSGCGHLAPDLCADQVGPSVVQFLNAQPPLKGEVIEIAERGN
ncbi:MAG TPA: alpha/beta hydrolase [Acidobacteriaceae bacterium]|jgi:pimeloyl-ACP methyl ester carboxylesterase